ncbi:MAG: hypothetical protein JSV88_07870 [Candidatus Aminicenantes bacterium]|nr:MAG: hypothetical protein JSV88_07870 [Candidatus Aminicenantes bacterium]
MLTKGYECLEIGKWGKGRAFDTCLQPLSISLEQNAGIGTSRILSTREEK